MRSDLGFWAVGVIVPQVASGRQHRGPQQYSSTGIRGSWPSGPLVPYSRYNTSSYVQCCTLHHANVSLWAWNPWVGTYNPRLAVQPVSPQYRYQFTEP